MSTMFPRTMVENLSLSRMIIGTNWLAGWSHTSASADAMIKERHSDPKTVIPMLETFLASGVDTLMGPISSLPVIIRAVKEAEQKTGKEIILIDGYVDVDTLNILAKKNTGVDIDGEKGPEFPLNIRMLKERFRICVHTAIR